MERARNIEYRFTRTGNMIEFDPYLYFERAHKFRGQEIKLLMRIPLGAQIYLDPSMEHIIYNIKNVTDTYDGDMLGHTWEMTEEGLTCIDCSWD